jgi:hypothetical protein
MLASKKPLPGKYLALKTEITREEELVMSFPPFLPKKAKLKPTISRKLRPQL